MNNLRKLRIEKGLTQLELGKIIGNKQNTISYWEKGTYDIDNENLQRLATFFNCSTDYLLGNTEIRNQEITKFTLTEQEKALLENFRSTTEQGKQRIIQSVLNICDEIEKKNTRANTKNSG